MWPTCTWFPAPHSSIANSNSATCRSNSACAAAISAAPCSRRSTRWTPRFILPGGYRLEWVGEFGNLQEAIARLSIAVPLSIALIVLLLYLNFGNLRDALLAASVIPMALLGGIFRPVGHRHRLQRFLGHRLRRPVRHRRHGRNSGLSYYHLSLESGLDRAGAMLQTCRTQLRPVMMTCIVACVGLFPRLLDRYRLAGSAAAGPGGRGRHAARARSHFAGACRFSC